MSTQDYDEKVQEKQEEKVGEKEREKREEKWHRDLLAGVVAALLLMWAGVVLLVDNLGALEILGNFLDALGIPTWQVSWEMPFFSSRVLPVFFLGGGIILLFETIVRLLIPDYRSQVLGTIIATIVFFALGMGNWSMIWPLILIAVGASIALRALTGRRG